MSTCIYLPSWGKFKKGSKLKVVKWISGSSGGIKEGDIITVNKIYHYDYNSESIFIEPVEAPNTGWSPWRFKVIEPSFFDASLFEVD